MVFVPPKDRVLEHSTSNSQTVFAVTGAVDASMNAFSALMAIGDTTIGGVVEPGVAFKSGVLTYSAANQITIDSTGFESKGTFSSGGTKEVFMGLPAKSALLVDGPQTLTTAKQASALKNIGAAQFSLINGKIVESHTGNAATFAIKTLAGTDPSTSDPVSVIFGDGTQRYLTAALSVTQASGTNMGTVSGVSFRLWFALFDDAGTLRMASRNCADTSGGVSGFPGGGRASTVNNNTANQQTWCSGVVLSNAQFVIIGFADYDGGLTTAGTWATSPTRIQMFGPHMKTPGDTVFVLQFPISTAFTTSSVSYVDSTVTATFTPTARQNPIRWQATVPFDNVGGGSNGLFARLAANGGLVGPTYYIYNGIGGSGSELYNTMSMDWTQLYDTTSSVTLTARVHGDSAINNKFPQGSVGAAPYTTVTLTEYMG
jgi:hypothetical protein